MNFNQKVKVVKLDKDEMMNLWGGYDDVTHLLGQIGVVTRIINPDTDYEQYGLMFDDYDAQSTRVRTGIIFNANQLEIVSDTKGDKA